MINYFVGNLGQARAYINKMNAFMGYPSLATKTTTYAEPRQHRGSGRGAEHLVIIKEVHSPKLKRRAKIKDIDDNSTRGEKSKRKSRKDLEDEGAFDDPDVLVL